MTVDQLLDRHGHRMFVMGIILGISLGFLGCMALNYVSRTYAQDRPPDLSDAEILQVARHVRAGRPLAEEQQAVVKKVNEMPEVRQLAAHQKAYQAEDESVRDSILKAHHLDPKKWTVDMQGQRIVPVQAALPPSAGAPK